METKAASVMKDALQLPESDRTALAVALFESLEPVVEPDTEALWREEIGRRTAELDSGAVRAIGWAEVRQRLNRRIH